MIACFFRVSIYQDFFALFIKNTFVLYVILPLFSFFFFVCKHEIRLIVITTQSDGRRRLHCGSP